LAIFLLLCYNKLVKSRKSIKPKVINLISIFTNFMSKNGINLKILLFIMVLLISTGVSCKCVSTDVRKQLKPITLEFWSTWDDSKVFVGLIEKYKEFHPNISINYRKLRYEEYEKMLLDAWVEGRRPDIFSIHNT